MRLLTFYTDIARDAPSRTQALLTTRNVAKWMASGVGPAQVMQATGCDANELATHIRAITADLRYLELMS